MTDMPHAEKVTALRSLSFFNQFDDDFLNTLAENMKVIDLATGEVLFRQGEQGNRMYFILEGAIDVEAQNDDGVDIKVATRRHGEFIGEMALISGQERTAIATASEATKLMELTSSSFFKMASSSPKLYDLFASQYDKRIQDLQLGFALTKLFGKDSAQLILSKHSHRFKSINLKTGDYLLKEGDRGDSMYIIVNGLLRTISEQGESYEYVSESHSGAIIGESALLSGNARMLSVIAARESYLVQLTREDFEAIVEVIPQIMMPISRLIAERLNTLVKKPKITHNSFVVIPLRSGLPIESFCEAMSQTMNNIDQTLFLDAKRFDQYFGQEGVAQTAVDDPLNAALTSWLYEQEYQNNFVIMLADPQWSAWTQRCLKHADRILFVDMADEGSVYEPSDFETRVISEYSLLRHELLLIHPAETERPQKTSRWLEPRDVYTHYHVRLNDDLHMRRLVRRLTGNAVCVVFSGGGARGYAHIGVIRALLDAGVEIDMIGGTSMGALIGAGYAYGHPPDMLENQSVDFSKYIFDYTLPMVAITRSKGLATIVDGLFGDVEIEDCWQNLFCLSSNLTTADLFIHQSGPLKRATRSSISIPGVFTPMMYGTDLLVDGAIMNNFPVDIMYNRYESGVIIGVNVTPRQEKRREYQLDRHLSGWRVLLSRINPFEKRMYVPSMVSIILRSLDVNSAKISRENQAMTDLLLSLNLQKYRPLDFTRYKEIIEDGKKMAEPLIKEWKTKNKLALH